MLRWHDRLIAIAILLVIAIVATSFRAAAFTIIQAPQCPPEIVAPPPAPDSREA